MIRKIGISNFKSIVELHMPLGRFNVLIGENGCGKSNIMEAIAFASAASVDQLDVQSLEKRGIRVSSPEFMYSAFENDSDKTITVIFDLDNEESDIFRMKFNDEHWVEVSRENATRLIQKFKGKSTFDLEEFINYLNLEMANGDDVDLAVTLTDKFDLSLGTHDSAISNFKIYSPDERSLRRFDNPDNTILGVNGSGLFSYLKKLSTSAKGAEMINEIRDNMRILDWFDDLEIPQDSLSGDVSMRFCDQYISETLKYFDQRSVNEAFLYLLFFFTLMVSDNSPKFFAIDNIESALNPKLCRKFTHRLIELAAKYDKQIIVTTHNPFVLDALDLNDDEQRLFVASRDIDGHTCLNNVKPRGGLSVPLSEAWMKGYIGGLPNNF